MKKKCLLLFIGIFFNLLFGQESVSLSFKFKPNKHYVLKSEILSENVVNFMADSLTLKEITQSGIKLPIHSTTSFLIGQEVITSSPDSNDCLNVEISIKDYDTKIMMNGMDMGNLIPDNLKQIKVNAVYHPENKLEVKEIIGENVSETMKTSIKETMSKMINKFNFPDTTMRIGDSFQQEVPVEIPMANFGSMRINIISEYKLERIEKEKSYLSVVSNIKLAFDNEKVESEATGSGKGELVYDSRAGYINTYYTDMKMKLKMKIGKMTIVTDSNTETRISCVFK